MAPHSHRLTGLRSKIRVEKKTFQSLKGLPAMFLFEN
jgi:hypothetical protein